MDSPCTQELITLGNLGKAEKNNILRPALTFTQGDAADAPYHSTL